MKIGLRGKLNILMVFLYLTTIGGGLISFMYYSPGQYREFEHGQEMLATWSGEIIEGATPYLNDENAFKEYLAVQAEQHKLIFKLLNNEREETWQAGSAKNGFKIAVHNMITDGTHVLYRLKTELIIPYQQLFYEVGRSFPLGMGVFFLFITLSLTIFLNILVVRPLKALARRMNQYALTGAQTKENKRGIQHDEIRLLEASFTDMVERIENLTREQQDMLAAISHDLNTPLTTIAGYTERLLSDRIRDEEKRHQAYRIINRKTHDIATISKQLGDIADVVEQGWMKDLRIVDARTLFDELFAPYREEWSDIDCKVSLQNSLPPELQVSVNVLSLRRVIANIMENALRYGESPLKIDAAVLRDGNFILLDIADNGPGVPQQALPFIFERFYRVDSSRSDSRTSRGLGLYICQEIIHAHGGEIKAYMPAGGGLGIRLTLPLYTS